MHQVSEIDAPTQRSGNLLDLSLKYVSEVPATLILVVEIIVLLAGVIARYVFATPLEWTDELATALALWLAMLGSVIALRKSEHMRLTVLVELLPIHIRPWVQTLALGFVVAFLLMLIKPAYEHFDNQWPVITPALEIHDGYRVIAILIGSVLMLLTAVTQMLRHSALAQVLGIAALLAGVAFVMWWISPVFDNLGHLNLFLFFVVLLGFCVAIGVPIAFSFGLATLSYLALSTDTPLLIMPSRVDEGISSLILLAVPLFVLLGSLIEMTGLARAMIDALAAFLGHMRGGLEYVLLGAMYLVSGISGSKAADMAAIAPALLPEMRKRGAHDGDLVSLLSASCAMSETIPPSLVLITIGSVTGVSIADLFTGGLLPAVVGMIALSVVVFVQTRGEDLTGVKRVPLREALKALVIALPALALPFVIRTAVVEGVATATEVSTLGIIYTVIVGILVYRKFNWRALYPMLVETAALSGAILIIVGCATAMAWALTQSGFSRQLVEWMALVPGGRWGFLGVSCVVFIVLGSVLEGIPAIVLFGPLLFPIARLAGVHEVHYAMVVVFAMGLGLFSPPFGVGFYAACAIGRTPPDRVIGRVWYHLGALLVALVVIALIPAISIVFL
jgi:tripartite ATP-independent transporter DctM subunit